MENAFFEYMLCVHFLILQIVLHSCLPFESHLIFPACIQKAHVQQFVATEDALNKAAEARNLSQKLIKRLHGSADGVSSDSVPAGTSQNLGSLRHFEVHYLS